MSLTEYRRKRDFRKTREPAARRPAGVDHRRFVVQKHAATRLHYDFRLEVGGTLKSWAVPKGIPLKHGEKRLAVQVEDHPVSYIDFEGTIPKGQYGGGTVMIWDRGSYEVSSRSPAKDLAAGKLHFTLHGDKLTGAWHLVRLRNDKDWLLIRGGEDHRPISRRREDMSALTGRTMTAIAKGGDPPAVARPVRKKPNPSTPEPERESSPAKGDAVQFVEPMKARLVASPPEGQWIYELKFDGIRALALVSGGAGRLLSRNQKDLAGRFPEVAEAVKALRLRDAIIDGEIVALDAKGRSSFQLLQARDLGRSRPPIYYYAFDLLRLGGDDLRKLPVTERKSRLERVLKASTGIIRYSAPLGSDGDALLRQARRRGLEGIVGKRMDSHYEAGRRSGAWVKIRVSQQQEMVIGGFTNPAGSRKDFGALLVGHYQKGTLKFAGKVGTGFSVDLLRQLHQRFRRIATPRCPFANLNGARRAHDRDALTPTELRRCHWVRPELVCQLRFAEWTRDGKLRQPVFLGLRDDKDPREVVAERV